MKLLTFRNIQIGIKGFDLRIQGMILFYSEIAKYLLEMEHPEFQGL